MQKDKTELECLVAPNLTVIATRDTISARVLFAGARNGVVTNTNRPPSKPIASVARAPIFVLLESEPMLLNEQAVLAALTKVGGITYHPDQEIYCYMIEHKNLSTEQQDGILFIDKCVSAKLAQQQTSLLLELETNPALLESVRQLTGIEKHSKHIERVDAVRLFELAATTASERVKPVIAQRAPTIPKHEDLTVVKAPHSVPVHSSNVASTAAPSSFPDEGNRLEHPNASPDTGGPMQNARYPHNLDNNRWPSGESLPEKLFGVLKAAKAISELRPEEQVALSRFEHYQAHGVDISKHTETLIQYMRANSGSQIFQKFLSGDTK